MFCPVCGSEYRKGFTECNDCQIPLVDTLPPEPELEYHEFVEIMTVFKEAHIALIKSVFDGAGLDYYFHGEFAHHLIPLPFSTRLMVRADQAGQGTRILAGLNLK